MGEKRKNMLQKKTIFFRSLDCLRLLFNPNSLGFEHFLNFIRKPSKNENENANLRFLIYNFEDAFE
jgi:hypothetical protein